MNVLFLKDCELGCYFGSNGRFIFTFFVTIFLSEKKTKKQKTLKQTKNKKFIWKFCFLLAAMGHRT